MTALLPAWFKFKGKVKNPTPKVETDVKPNYENYGGEFQDDFARMGEEQKPPITHRKVGNLANGPLEDAVQTSGYFPVESGPANGTLYRSTGQGEITSYATYDSKGFIIKRVDVTGAAHRGVDTPHVIEYGRNSFVDSNGKTVFRVQSPNTKLAPRPANYSELP